MYSSIYEGILFLGYGNLRGRYLKCETSQVPRELERA